MTVANNAKFNMIEQQIRPWEVLDNKVLTTLNSIDREDYVRDIYKGLAYADCQIPLNARSKMLPPTIEGRLLQSLLVQAEDTVLVVGSGSGYISACLASIASHVTSIDIDAENLEFARQNLAACGISNVTVKKGNGFEIDEPKRFDVIAVSGSVSSVPQNLQQALNIGGRMFIICGRSPVMQALLITRIGDAEWSTQSLFETDLPALLAS